MPIEKTEVPFPADPTDRVAVYEWHEKLLSSGIAKARDEIKSQSTLYVGMFSLAFAIAGGLIVFAGWLGYKGAVDRAVENVNMTLSEDVRNRIVNGTANDLMSRVQTEISNRAQKDVSAKIDAMIEDADKHYVRLFGNYLIEQTDTAGYLTVPSLKKEPYTPVQTMQDIGPHGVTWYIKPNPNEKR